MKMLNKSKFLNLYILGIFIIIFGCQKFEVGNDFLSQPPELSYTVDSVFSSADRAREQLWNIYSTLPYHLGYGKDNEGGRIGPVAWKSGVGNDHAYQVPLWSMTDMTRMLNPGGSINQWAEGTVTAQNSWAHKYHFTARLGWEGIRDAFIFIDNIDNVPDMDSAEKKMLKAEAKVIIATLYVEMFRHKGGILYINHAYSPTEKIDSIPRLTVMQTVDTIRSYIDEALPDLPFVVDNPAIWSGRITSAAALSLKIRLLHFAASPLLNSDQPYLAGEAASKHLVWTGGYKEELWLELRDVVEELIQKVESSSYYKMENTGNPQEDYFRAYYERTPETLYSTRVSYRWVSGERVDPIRNQHWYSDTSPLENYASKFPMKNGKSIDDPESGYDPQNPYYNRDPRMYEHLLLNGRPYQGRKAELFAGGRERKDMRNKFAHAGYRMYKWKTDLNTGSRPPVQFSYFRIPELYLIHAEVLNQLNNGPTPEAFESINKVRERVNVGPIEEWIGKDRAQTTKEEFLDAILNERVLELGGENSRWFDMVRYKMEDVFTAQDMGMDITLKVDRSELDFNNVDYDEHDQYFIYEVNEVPNEFRWQDEFHPKYYLDPWPFSEIQKGYGLVQNPGWEL